MTTPADLAVDTAVRRDGAVPGRYFIAMPTHWDYLLPSGGVIMTAALRAAAAELGDPGMRLASATTIFASPIHPGALVADVHVIRRGRGASQLRVVLKHATPPADAPAEENAGLECLVTFVRDGRKGPDVIGTAMPGWAKSLADSVPVEDEDPGNPHVRMRFYHQLECRIADGARHWRAGDPDFTAGPARYARWIRYRTPQRGADGLLDRLALPPLLDTMPTALHRAIGPRPYRFYAPSLDLTAYVVDDTASEWLLVATTVKRARGGWGIGDAEIWDDAGRLVAYGTQAMYLHGLAGEPPIVDATQQ